MPNDHDQQLSPHFSLAEFTFSRIAVERGIRNEPLPGQVANLRRLALVLEEARVALGGAKLIVGSGFRAPALNTAVGGSIHPPSAHMDGRAADFIAPGYGTPREICKRLSDYGLIFDQLIDEGAWVHLGIETQLDEPRREVLTAFRHPGQNTTYAKGLV